MNDVSPKQKETRTQLVLDAVPGRIRGEIKSRLPLTAAEATELRTRLLARSSAGFSPEAAKPTDDPLADSIYRQLTQRAEEHPDETRAVALDHILAELT